MFSPLVREGKLLGFQLRKDGRFYFFGSRHVKAAELPVIFPQFQFCFLKQVHSKTVLPATTGEIQVADAHFTNHPGVAVVANSADCVPILLSSPTHVCAIHSGWRGSAQNIVSASAEHMKSVNFAAIGPHIQQNSFEIGDDALTLLLQATPPGTGPFFKDIGGGKSLFDLHTLTRAQLNATYGAALSITACFEDTKTNPEFHSFRRDRERAERQYSFVAIENELGSSS